MNTTSNTIFGRDSSTFTRVVMVARMLLAIAIIVPANLFDEMVYQRYMVPKDFGPSRIITHEMIALGRPIIAAVVFIGYQFLFLRCFFSPFYQRRAERQIKAHQDKLQESQTAKDSVQRGNELLKKSLSEFDEIRNQVILIVLRYNEGQYVTNQEREILDKHRARLQELYPLLCGQEMFDEATYRRMLTQIAVFLGEELTPGERSPTPLVTHH